MTLRVFHFAPSACAVRRNRYPPAGTGEVVAAGVVPCSRLSVSNERGLLTASVLLRASRKRHMLQCGARR